MGSVLKSRQTRPQETETHPAGFPDFILHGRKQAWREERAAPMPFRRRFVALLHTVASPHRVAAPDTS